jgi:hypothetical protein
VSGAGVAQRIVREFVVEWDAGDELALRERDASRTEANPAELAAEVRRVVARQTESPEPGEPADAERRRRDWLTGEPSF